MEFRKLRSVAFGLIAFAAAVSSAHAQNIEFGTGATQGKSGDTEILLRVTSAAEGDVDLNHDGNLSHVIFLRVSGELGVGGVRTIRYADVTAETLTLFLGYKKKGNFYGDLNAFTLDFTRDLDTGLRSQTLVQLLGIRAGAAVDMGALRTALELGVSGVIDAQIDQDGAGTSGVIRLSGASGFRYGTHAVITTGKKFRLDLAASQADVAGNFVGTGKYVERCSSYTDSDGYEQQDCTEVEQTTPTRDATLRTLSASLSSQVTSRVNVFANSVYRSLHLSDRRDAFAPQTTSGWRFAAGVSIRFR